MVRVRQSPASRPHGLFHLRVVGNGIQNSTMIYQPVLQWGPGSAAGGGNYWAVVSWYADGQGGQAFYSNLVTVNPGDTLVGVVTLTGHTASFKEFQR
jgi:hypothetical protein